MNRHRSTRHIIRARLAVVLMILTMPFSVAAQGGAWSISERLTGSFHYRQIDCADSANCMGLVYNGSRELIRRSTDGGSSWHLMLEDSLRQSPLRYPYKHISVSYPDPMHCFVGCSDGVVRRSTDHGASWQVVKFDTTLWVTSIDMADSLHGIASQALVVRVTDDGWRTWKSYPIEELSNETLSIYDVSMPSPGHIIVGGSWAGETSKSIISTDNGESWQEYSGPANCLQISFLNDSLGWAAGVALTGVGERARDVIWRTTDGGKSWTNQLDREIEPANGLWAIDFADSLNGIAVGSILKVLQTTDGGENWFVPDNRPPELEQQSLLLHIRTVSYPHRARAVAGTAPFDAWALVYRDPVASIAPEPQPLDADLPVMWPNPLLMGSRGMVLLELPSPSWIRAALFNSLGQECRVLLEAWRSGEVRLAIDAEGLAPGAYFMRVTSDGRPWRAVSVVVR